MKKKKCDRSITLQLVSDSRRCGSGYGRFSQSCNTWRRPYPGSEGYHDALF